MDHCDRLDPVVTTIMKGDTPSGKILLFSLFLFSLRISVWAVTDFFLFVHLELKNLRPESSLSNDSNGFDHKYILVYRCYLGRLLSWVIIMSIKKG